MRSLVKKIFLITFFAMLIVVFKTNKVFAVEPYVYINGRTDNIYDTNIDSTAIFDKTTNTLTLNNYQSGGIEFYGFNDGDTVKVKLKGTNKIEEPIGNYMNELWYSGISAQSYIPNSLNLEIIGEDGSVLEINNYHNGIYADNGDISLNNVSIKMNGNAFGGIYVDSGNFYINDSKIEIKNGNNGLWVDDGKMDIKNSNIKINNITGIAILSTDGESTKIVDSQIDIGTAKEAIDSRNMEMINTKLNVSDAEHGIANRKKLTIKDCEINLDNTNYTHSGYEDGQYNFPIGIYNYLSEINLINNNITINNFNEGISTEGSLYIKGKKLIINSKLTGIYVVKLPIMTYDSGVEFESGEIYVNSAEDKAIMIYNPSNGFKISDKLQVLEKNLDLRKAEIDGNYLYSIGEEFDPTTINNYDAFIEKMASKFSIVPKKVVSFDGNGAKGTMADVWTYGKYVLPENGFEVPENKIFKGWSLTAAGDAIITELEVKEDTKLYAIWMDKEPVKYIVTFDSNGYGVAPEAQILVKNEKVIQPEDLVEDGFIFEGWFIDKECTVAYDFETPVTEDIILYAKWTKEINNPPTGDSVIFVGAGLVISLAAIYITKRKFMK